MDAHSPPCRCKRKRLQLLPVCRIDWSSVLWLRDLLSWFVVFMVVAVVARVGFAARAFRVAGRMGIAREGFLELFAKRHCLQVGQELVFLVDVVDYGCITGRFQKAFDGSCLSRVKLTTRFMSWRGCRRGMGWRSPLIQENLHSARP